MKLKLWTVSTECFATGEGETLAAIIGYAKTKKEAKQLFVDKFGDHLAIDCEIKSGISKNEVVKTLFSKKLLKHIKDNNSSSGALQAYAHYYVNKS